MKVPLRPAKVCSWMMDTRNSTISKLINNHHKRQRGTNVNARFVQATGADGCPAMRLARTAAFISRRKIKCID